MVFRLLEWVTGFLNKMDKGWVVSLLLLYEDVRTYIKKGLVHVQKRIYRQAARRTYIQFQNKGPIWNKSFHTLVL